MFPLPSVNPVYHGFVVLIFFMKCLGMKVMPMLYVSNLTFGIIPVDEDFYNFSGVQFIVTASSKETY